ncbi:MAG: methyltransferase domain-containing protein [Saprospiraceae bacterium]|nr:methyltransferase domain-containing protein [Saprospiraceae bacterium]MCF8249744.1 methyltransferase domain-containing protein [Saprospiraceae bacterium]MCF8279229.1 methyltransferase domain-containing protein [Bacteroidales bacterium]MCF8312777.1 methyltransferase domain-containing protein [Saprospiraceae bacterium]MCF8441224.1 methyltransferase domain-containing protein [Saprospiraceae bacterium]
MFTSKDIADYYNTTQIHYEKWWNLKEGLSLHYGIWEKETKNFTESLMNTNKVLMELCEIKETDIILDAGGGVGGAAMFLHENKNVEVIGITLSQKQVDFANNMAKQKKIDHKVNFLLMDYTQTTFEDESFDVVWACESVSSAPDKLLFINEAYRLLKKGGKLILSDCFITDKNQSDPHKWIKKWGETWGVSNLVTTDFFLEGLKSKGFSTAKTFDYTTKIKKSAKRMYHAAILGFLPSEIYNLFNPNVSRFAKHHYKSGYFQYRALKENLWEYNIILAEK